MKTVRAFIAVDLSSAILAQLASLSAQLQRGAAARLVRWVAVNNIHLTLKFLGDVPVERLEGLKQMLAAAANRCRAFDLAVGGLGVFPSLRQPRVVWVGTQPSPHLQALQKGLESGAEGLGFPKEERPFSPHLTLGRVAREISTDQARQLSQALAAFTVGDLGLSPVLAVHLYQSDLRPGGSVYTVLSSASLQPPSASQAAAA